MNILMTIDQLNGFLDELKEEGIEVSVEKATTTELTDILASKCSACKGCSRCASCSSCSGCSAPKMEEDYEIAA
jgi:hypothetical protein